jgi:hypothetical protein
MDLKVIKKTRKKVSKSMDNINDLYIYIDNDCIPKEKCAEIIKMYDSDPNKKDSSNLSGINNDIINISYLNISNQSVWSDIDNLLSTLLHSSIEKYITHIIQKLNDKPIDKIQNSIINTFGQVVDFGYQIQSYKQNVGFYEWHHDNISLSGAIQNNINQVRLLTFIWYLNDVDIGGETEFINGLIKPSAGKLLLFPATFTYPHTCKMPISNDKYIITGWIGYKTNGYCL